MPCAHGARGRLLIGGALIEFVQFVPNGTVKSIVNGSENSIRGTLEQYVQRVVPGVLLAGFNVVLEPSYAEMTHLLTNVLGFNLSSGTYVLTDNVPSVDVYVDYDSKIHRFSGAKCGAFTLVGQKGVGPVRLALSFQAENWETTSITFPSYSGINPGIPYAFHTGTLTTGGVSRQYDRFSLSLDRKLFVEHNNSIRPTDICPTKTSVVFQTSFPYAAGHYDPIDNALAGAGAVAVVLQFQSGTKQTVWTMQNSVLIARGVPIQGKTNIRATHQFQCFRDDDDSTIKVTHVDT